MQLRVKGKEKQMLCSGQKMFTCWGGGASCYVGVGVGVGVGMGIMASLVAQTVEYLTTIQETWSLIPGLGRSPGEGNSYPLWCSSLEKSKDRGEASSLFIHWFTGPEAVPIPWLLWMMLSRTWEEKYFLRIMISFPLDIYVYTHRSENDGSYSILNFLRNLHTAS